MDTHISWGTDRLRAVDGMTLIELLVATTIMVIIAAGVGMLVVNAFASTTQDVYRVGDISEAQKVSATLNQLLSNAIAVCAGGSVPSSVTINNAGGWTQYNDRTCTQPPGQSDVAAGNPPTNTYSSSTALYFFAPENLPVNVGVAPPAVTYTEYEASLDGTTTSYHTVNGFTSAHYFILKDLSNGNVSFLGDDINGTAANNGLTFTYYPWNSQSGATGSCAQNGQANPDTTGPVTAAVAMTLYMKGGSNDTSNTSYTSCIYLPGAAY